MEVTPQEKTGRARQTREGRGSLLIMFPRFLCGKSTKNKCCDASYKIESLLHKAELGNMLPQLATSKFVAWHVGSTGGNTGNNAFELAMQQCCATS